MGAADFVRSALIPTRNFLDAFNETNFGDPRGLTKEYRYTLRKVENIPRSAIQGVTER